MDEPVEEKIVEKVKDEAKVKKFPKHEAEKTEDSSKDEGKVGRKENITLVVLKMNEIGSIVDLGLGRGVNATHSSPWLQKSSFQVRPVTPENVIGTEEGGILQSYIHEVVSIEEVQSQMSTSVPASSLVSVGIDEELSRSYSTSRRSMGKKIITRSVMFKPDIKDHMALTDTTSPQQTPAHQTQEENEVEEVKSKHSSESNLGTLSSAPNAKLFTFEQCLSHWIVESLLDDEAPGVEEPDPSDDPNQTLTKIILHWPGGAAGARAMLKQKCSEFVEKYSITHYVSGIEMGAAQYQVISEQQYVKEFGVKNSLEILKVVNKNIFSFKSKFTKKALSSQLTEIGRLQGNTVKRGTTDEAVVGVTFQPISALITLRVLRSAMQTTIKNYIEDQQFSRAGPFIISCNNERIYLKVTPDLQVVATTKIEESSDFFISYNEDGCSAYEFSITYMVPSSLFDRDVKPIASYLYAPVNIRGKNRGPLTVRLDAPDSHTKMTLRSRRINQFHPVDTKDWLSSRDIFYISCKSTVLHTSFICVKRRPHYSRVAEEYITSCVNTINKHDIASDHFMLFRLLRAAKRDPPEREQKKNEDIEEPLGIRRSSRAFISDAAQLAGTRHGLEMGEIGKLLAAELKNELEAEM